MCGKVKGVIGCEMEQEGRKRAHLSLMQKQEEGGVSSDEKAARGRTAFGHVIRSPALLWPGLSCASFSSSHGVDASVYDHRKRLIEQDYLRSDDYWIHGTR